MITVLASIYVKPGEKGKFLDIFKANVPAVCAEKGCVSYVPMVDVDTQLPPQEMDENIVTIVEQWESIEALKLIWRLRICSNTKIMSRILLKKSL